MSEKKCNKCYETKPLEAFEYHDKRKGTRRTHCRICLARERAEKYAVNAERHREDKRLYRSANLEKMREYERAQYNKHIESKQTKSREYGRLHKQEKSAYNKANASKFQRIHCERVRKRRQNDPSFKILTVCRGRIHRALVEQYSEKASSTTDLLGCTPHECRTHIEAGFYDRKNKDGSVTSMSWQNYGRGHEGWQIDHIEAAGLFDLTDLDQQKRCFHYLNLQPLWWGDHQKKTIEDRRKIRTKRLQHAVAHAPSIL